MILLGVNTLFLFLSFDVKAKKKKKTFCKNLHRRFVKRLGRKSRREFESRRWRFKSRRSE